MAATTWFQRMARVREGVHGSMPRSVTPRHSRPARKLQLTIAQLPYNTDDRWVGLPLKPGQTLPGGKLSLAVQSAAPVDVVSR